MSFAEKFFVGNKKVQKRAEIFAGLRQRGEFRLGIEAGVSGIVFDKGVIFLFGITVVVAVAGAAACKAKGFRDLPPVQNVMIYKFAAVAAVVAVKFNHREG
jgi:hypothetical protein